MPLPRSLSTSSPTAVPVSALVPILTLTLDPSCSPGPALVPVMPLPPQKLYDKVIQRQLLALILGLNPVSAGASLSLLPLPGLCLHALPQLPG